MLRAAIMASVFLWIAMLTAGCTSESMSYEATIVQWQGERLTALTKPDGWVTLVGLYPLKKERNVLVPTPFVLSGFRQVLLPRWVR